MQTLPTLVKGISNGGAEKLATSFEKLRSHFWKDIKKQLSRIS